VPALLPQILRSEERDTFRAALARSLADALPYQRVAALDEADEFPRDTWYELGRLGALGLGIEPELGGAGGGVSDALVATIEIARRYPSLAVDYVLCAMLARTLTAHGTAEQRARWLGPVSAGETIVAYGISEPDGGTDALALRTRATPIDGGWRVDGAKLWTSLAAESDAILTLVRTDDPPAPERRATGLSLIAVPTDQPGVSVRRVHLAGMRGAGTCEVTFDGARAPAEALVGPRGRGFHLLRDTLDVERLLSAGISLGIGTGALELAVSYAAEREAFGRPIGAFQAVAHPLVDAAAALAGALLLTERAAQGVDAGDAGSPLPSMAKLAAGEATAVVVDRGMRTMAAMGLARESPMQMYFRDARLQLFSPVSNEMVRNLLAEAMGLPRSY
jgi:alkylation response protein AidB-like acyl-CoA dehydrogenase